MQPYRQMMVVTVAKWGQGGGRRGLRAVVTGRVDRLARFAWKRVRKMIIWQLCYCHVCFNAFYIIKTNDCVSTSPAWTTANKKRKEKKMLKKKFLNLSVLASGGSQDGFFFLSHRWETWRVTQPLSGSITKMKTKTVVLRVFRPTQHCAV